MQSTWQGEALTVFLVHQNLKRVHLIVLKRLSDLLCHVFVRQLPVHEAAGENTVPVLVQYTDPRSDHERVSGQCRTCRCCFSAWPRLDGTQTACRSHRCCRRWASPRSERSPARSWYLTTETIRLEPVPAQGKHMMTGRINWLMVPSLHRYKSKSYYSHFVFH